MKTETIRVELIKAGDLVRWQERPTRVQQVETTLTHTRILILGNWLSYELSASNWLELVIGWPEQGVKYDEDKPRFSLVPSASLRAIAQVLTYGARKYPSADNWKRVDNARERYTDALLRHVYAWMDGEVLDPESGLHHLAHAGCCVLFLLHFEAEK